MYALFVYCVHVAVLHLNLPPQVLDYKKPYNQGGWIALHAFTRCMVRLFYTLSPRGCVYLTGALCVAGADRTNAGRR